MDSIRKALELAKTGKQPVSMPVGSAPRALPVGSAPRAPRILSRPAQVSPSAGRQQAQQIPAINLDVDYLHEMRIIAHDSTNPLTASFDVLRTTVLREMDAQKWQTVLITSPSPGCGKSVSAINLAFSISRQEGRNVILADFDLRKPTVAEYLGYKPQKGFEMVVAGNASVSECITRVSAGVTSIGVLASTSHVRHPAEFIASTQMRSVLSELKNSPGRPIIVIDTSPIMVSDDVLALLPQVDCVIMAVAEKVSTINEIETCERHLQSSNYLGMVLTKSHEKSEGYYAYY